MSKRNKIILFRPNADKMSRDAKTIPLTLLSVAAPLLDNNFNVIIYDAIVDLNYTDTILKELDDALCIGLSIMTGHQIKEGLELCKKIKHFSPKTKIIWGGWHPTILPNETVIDGNIDIVVAGPGEQTFLELCIALKNKTPINNIRGLFFKENKKILSTDKRYLKELDKKILDLPYKLLNMEKYIQQSAWGARTTEYRSSYGCPYNCTFCPDSIMSNRYYLGLEPEQVIRELSNLKKDYNIDSVLLLDNEFFINTKRVQTILQGLIDAKINIKLGNLYVRANQLLKCDQSIWDTMKKAGVKQLLVGVESAQQKTLDNINKKTKEEDLIKLKKITHKHDIGLFLSFMLGFPFEDSSSEEELEAVLRTIERCHEIDNKQLIFISIYMPFPGTELFEECKRRGLNIPLTLDYWGNIDLTKRHTPWISKKTEKKVNMLNKYIFLYISEQFGNQWNTLYQGKLKTLKRIYHNILKKIAVYRFKNRYFDFAIEYYFLEFIMKLKLLYKKYSLKHK